MSPTTTTTTTMTSMTTATPSRIAPPMHPQQPTSKTTSKTTTTNIPDKLPQALQEAEAAEQTLVQSSTTTTIDLDTFHLLGVVADPRYSVVPIASTSDTTTGNNNAETDTSYYLNYTTHLFQQTLHDVSQLTLESAFQSALETIQTTTTSMDMGTSLHGSSFHGLESTDPLTVIPPELQTIGTTSLEQYMEATGPQATALVERIAAASEGNGTTSTSDTTTTATVDPLFFTEPFCLTHPTTFAHVFLEGSSEDTSELLLHTKDATTSWFPLRPESTWQSQWDALESQLVSHVKQYAPQFFVESQRLGGVSSTIGALLDRVVGLEAQLQLTPTYSTVATTDTERERLRQLQATCQHVAYVVEQAALAQAAAQEDVFTALEHCTNAQTCLDDDEHGLERLHALQPVQERLHQLHRLLQTRLRDALVAACCSVEDNDSDALQDPATLRFLHAVSLDDFRTAYQTRIEQDIRMTVRTTVTECYSGTTTSSNNNNTTAFLACWDLVVEQVVPIVAHIATVDAWVRANTSTNDTVQSVLTAACEMVCKSMGELLRMRKQQQQHQSSSAATDATTATTTLHDMKAIWTRCMSVIQQLEPYTASSRNNNNKYTAILKSTLLAQTKAFLERQHDTHMSRLAAALDAERWVACDVAPARQDAITRLCTGRNLLLDTAPTNNNNAPSVPYMNVADTRYKVVWSCLLLLEMVVSNVAAAAQFGIATHPKKVADLLRLFHTRATHLVLGAGAMHAHAKLRSINAKHLSLVTQSVGLVLDVLPHIRGALQQCCTSSSSSSQQAQLIRATLDPIRIEYLDHNEKVLNKLVSIIGGLVERELSKRIAGTDFDARAATAGSSNNKLCPFLDDITSHTRRMHQVIKAILRPDHLQDTFSKIFAFLDTKVPALLVTAADGSIFSTNSPLRQEGKGNSPKQQQRRTATVPSFAFPTTQAGKRQLLWEVDTMTQQLNGLEGVRPWDFTATQALEKTLQYEDPEAPASAETEASETKEIEESHPKEREGKANIDNEHTTSPETIQPEQTNATSDDDRTALVEGESNSQLPPQPEQNACAAKQKGDDDRADINSVVSTTTTVTSTVDPGDEEHQQRREQEDEEDSAAVDAAGASSETEDPASENLAQSSDGANEEPQASIGDQ